MPTGPGPLDGIKVLDFSRVYSGPFCGRALSDLGADVVKVEPPNADLSRFLGVRSGSMSLYHAQQNAGKRNISLDLNRSEARELLLKLASTFDVVLENFRPGVMARFGLDYEAIAAVNPRVVYASLTGWGQDGPWRHRRAYAVIVHAEAGLTAGLIDRGGEPRNDGYSHADVYAGLECTIGILAALQQRERTGRGQHVDTSLFECGVAWSVWQSAKYVGTGEIPGAMGSAHPLSAPYQAVQAKDKYFIIGAGNQKLFRDLCRLLGHPEWADDERFATQPARQANLEELATQLESVFRHETAEYWLARLRETGIPCGPINNVAEMLADPQARARGMVVDIEHPIAGPTTVLGNPVKFSDTPATIRAHAPALGEHTDRVLTEILGYSPGQIEVLRAEGVI